MEGLVYMLHALQPPFSLEIFDRGSADEPATGKIDKWPIIKPEDFPEDINTGTVNFMELCEVFSVAAQPRGILQICHYM